MKLVKKATFLIQIKLHKRVIYVVIIALIVQVNKIALYVMKVIKKGLIINAYQSKILLSLFWLNQNL